MPEQQLPVSFGPNAWLVDEMYDQYVQDPSSVSESWREFFEDYRKGGTRQPGSNGQAEAATATAATPAPVAPEPAPTAAPGPAQGTNGQQQASVAAATKPATAASAA